MLKVSELVIGESIIWIQVIRLEKSCSAISERAGIEQMLSVGNKRTDLWLSPFIRLWAACGQKTCLSNDFCSLLWHSIHLTCFKSSINVWIIQVGGINFKFVSYWFTGWMKMTIILKGSNWYGELYCYF